MSEKVRESDLIGAVKHDKGKVRHSLIPWEPLHKLAEVYTLGAAKYGDHNWRKGMPYTRVLDALKRHLHDWEVLRVTRDEQDGQHPLASVAWCAFTLIYYEMYGVGEDDRPIRPIPVMPVEIPVEGPVVETKLPPPRTVDRDSFISKRERVATVLCEAGDKLPGAWKLSQMAQVSHNLAARALQVWHKDIDVGAFIRLGPCHFQRKMARGAE